MNVSVVLFTSFVFLLIMGVPVAALHHLSTCLALQISL